MAYASELSEQAHIIRKIPFEVTAVVAAALLLAANIMIRAKPFKSLELGRPGFAIIFHDSPYLVSIASCVFCLNNRIIELRFFRAFCVNLFYFSL